LQGHVIEQLGDTILNFQERGSDMAIFPLHAELPILLVRTIGDTQGALDAFENLRDRNLVRASG
jgi:hypothetical protein